MPEMGWLLVWFLAGRRQRTPDGDDLLLPGDQELLLLGGVGLAGQAEVEKAGEDCYRLGIGGRGEEKT